MQMIDVRSSNVVGVAPRSIYGEITEAAAWHAATQAARGRIHPTYVFGNRRILGITQGRGVFSSDVRYVRFRKGTPWSEMELMRHDMLYMTWTDYNSLASSLINGQFGRVYFLKTSTSTPVNQNWYDLWPVTGQPQAGSIAGTAFTANSFTDASVGSMQHSGNVTGQTKHVLSFGCAIASGTGLLMLYDRVLSYDLCTYNASVNQAMTNTNTAQRYNAGAPGLSIFVCTNTVNGATANNITQLQYTDQSGNTLQSIPTTPTVASIISGAAPTTTLGARTTAPAITAGTVAWSPFLPLNVGDSGVRLIANYTTSAANTGTVSFVLCKPLCDLIVPIVAVPREQDMVFHLSELERIYDGACLSFLVLVTVAAASAIQGNLKYGWQ